MYQFCVSLSIFGKKQVASIIPTHVKKVVEIHPTGFYECFLIDISALFFFNFKQ